MRIKIDLTEFVSQVSTTDKRIRFTSISNMTNVIDTYSYAQFFEFKKTSSITTIEIFGEGHPVVTLANSNCTNLSTNNTYIEFDGNLNASDMLDMAWFIEKGIATLDLDGNTTLLTYKQNSNNNVLEKELTLVNYILGKFNHSIAVKNLNIDIKNFNNDFNYVFIPLLNRYYYVDSVEIVSADYVRLHLREDVLMSWKDLIKSQTAFVERTGTNSLINLDIEDSEIKTAYDKNIYVYDVATPTIYEPQNSQYVITIVRS